MTVTCLLLCPIALAFSLGRVFPLPVFMFAFKAYVISSLTARTYWREAFSQEGRHSRVA